MYFNICDGRRTDNIWILSLTSTFGGRGNNQNLLKMFPIETLQQCDSLFSFAHLAISNILKQWLIINFEISPKKFSCKLPNIMKVKT